MGKSERSPQNVANYQCTKADSKTTVREIKPSGEISTISAMNFSALLSSTDPMTTTNVAGGEKIFMNRSLSLSKFMSDVKDLSSETASLLLEQDAQLLTNLSRVSIDDLTTEGSRLQIDAPSISISNLLSKTLSGDITNRAAIESSVMIIATVNFYNCGYPAFDDSFELLGFYHPIESGVRCGYVYDNH